MLPKWIPIVTGTLIKGTELSKPFIETLSRELRAKTQNHLWRNGPSTLALNLAPSDRENGTYHMDKSAIDCGIGIGKSITETELQKLVAWHDQHFKKGNKSTHIELQIRKPMGKILTPFLVQLHAQLSRQSLQQPKEYEIEFRLPDGSSAPAHTIAAKDVEVFPKNASGRHPIWIEKKTMQELETYYLDEITPLMTKAVAKAKSGATKGRW